MGSNVKKARVSWPSDSMLFQVYPPFLLKKKTQKKEEESLMFSLTISLPGSLSSFVKKVIDLTLNHMLKLEAAVTSHCLLTMVNS